MHTWSGCTGTHAPLDRSRTFHPLSRHSHSMKAATALGEHSRILAFEILRVPYGSGMGSAITAGWSAGVSTPPSSGKYSGMAVSKAVLTIA